MILFYRHSRQWVTSASSETAPTEASSKQQELRKKGAYKLFTLLMGDQCREDICSNKVIRGAAAVSTALGFWNPIQQTIDRPVVLLTVSFCVFLPSRRITLPGTPWPFFFLRPVMHMPCGCGIRSLPLRACVNTAAIPGMAVNSGGRKCPQSG